MADIVTMPKLGFDMAEGILVRWVVGEDEPVEKGQVLAEIETDKATVEVESSHSGVIRRHLVEEGEVVPINKPIAVVGEADEKIDFDQLLGEAPPAKGEEPRVERGAEPEREEEKVTKPEAVKGKGDGRAVVEAAKEEEKPLPEGVRASPIARRMAEERSFDLRDIKGSGPGGRIVKADVEAHRGAPPVVEERRVEPVPMAIGEAPPDRHISLSKLRAAIGRRMVQSKQQFPQFYVTSEYDVAELMALRAQINGLLPEEEKTSVNDYIIKAVALTLREFPNLNAMLDETNQEVVQFGHVNIGVAVATEKGLLTVVCHDANLKSIRQISREVREMAGRAREGKVRQEDIEGSTFTVSNLGMFDVEEFIAIINPPEAAILAVGSVTEVPVIEAGEIRSGLRMKGTISADHRVSDGAEAARYMQALKKYLEGPLRLMV
jgi:pyruvate dehydrogenase E2 component (dihydrolipoamide acetyltransferase)